MRTQKGVAWAIDTGTTTPPSTPPPLRRTPSPSLRAVDASLRPTAVSTAASQSLLATPLRTSLQLQETMLPLSAPAALSTATMSGGVTPSSLLSSRRELRLHAKLSSPDRCQARQRSSSFELRQRAQRKQEVAVQNREKIGTERELKHQAALERERRVLEWQAQRVASNAVERENIALRQRAAEARHEEHLRGVKEKAHLVVLKAEEIAFITSMAQEQAKLALQQKLEAGEARRLSLLDEIRQRQKQKRVPRAVSPRLSPAKTSQTPTAPPLLSLGGSGSSAIPQRSGSISCQVGGGDALLLDLEISTAMERKAKGARARLIAICSTLGSAQSSSSAAGSSSSSAGGGDERVAGLCAAIGSVTVPPPTVGDADASEYTADAVLMASAAEHAEPVLTELLETLRLATRHCAEPAPTVTVTPALASRTRGLSSFGTAFSSGGGGASSAPPSAAAPGTSAVSTLLRSDGVRALLRLCQLRTIRAACTAHVGRLCVLAIECVVVACYDQRARRHVIATGQAGTAVELLAWLLSSLHESSLVVKARLVRLVLWLLTLLLRETMDAVGGHATDAVTRCLADAGVELRRLVVGTGVIVGLTKLCQATTHQVALGPALSSESRQVHALKLSEQSDRELGGASIGGIGLFDGEFENDEARQLHALCVSMVVPAMRFLEGFSESARMMCATTADRDDMSAIVAPGRATPAQLEAKKNATLFTQSNLAGIVSLMLTVVMHYGGGRSLSVRPRSHSRSSSGGALRAAHFTLPPPVVRFFIIALRTLVSMLRLDTNIVPDVLGSDALQMEFHHLLSHLLLHVTNTVQKQHPSKDRLLYPLLDSLFTLIGLYTLHCNANQETFSWGKNPTPLQQLCSLPFRFYCDPKLRSLLLPTIAAASFGNARSLQIVANELSPRMLADFIREKENGYVIDETVGSAAVSDEASAGGAAAAIARTLDVYSWRYFDSRIPRQYWSAMCEEFDEAAQQRY